MIGENGMKKNLLMYGIGSFKNHGCEAIVNGTINHLDKSKYSISLANLGNSISIFFIKKTNFI